MNNKFRYDINALRALSVFGVVVFHFFPNILPGGFAGVDVFFVISGYLMASICIPKIRSKQFSLSAFYGARCRRILPALIVFCGFVLAFNWFNLSPLKYSELAKHTLSSLLFFSNFTYWLEFGYFDGFTKSKWLLHTWSLSVEWQFYIFYPLFLLLVNRFLGDRQFKRLIVSLTLFAFILTVIIVTKKPTASFYLLPTRAWELLIGTIIFVYPLSINSVTKTKVTVFGLTIIFLSFLLLTSNVLWPSLWTLLPVIGSVLVLYGQSNDLKLFSNRVIKYLGTRSYSLYLWHWFFAVYCFTHGETRIYVLLLAIMLSIVCAEFSYRYVESSKFSKQGKAIVYSLLLVCIASSTIIFNQGMPNRVQNDLTKLTANFDMPSRLNGYCFQDFDQRVSLVSEVDKSKCIIGEQSKEPKVLLFGDSFAGHNEPFWDKFGLHNNTSIQVITTNWCSPSITENFIWLKSHIAYKQCKINRQYVLKNISNYNAVIIGGAWSTVRAKDQLKDIYDFIDYATSHGVKVVIMPSPPSFDINVLDYFKDAYTFGRNLNYETLPNKSNLATLAVNKEFEVAFSEQKNVFVIPQDSLFNGQHSFKNNGIEIPYSLDGSHISIAGSKHSFKNFLNSNNFNELNKFIFEE